MGLTDHLGSVVAVTDGTDALLSQQRYLPFGGERTNIGTIYPSGHASETDYGYTGQRDLEMGLMDYKARFYSPLLGRFIQPDTITPGGPQGLNRYSYVSNNPVNFNDPTGHIGCSGKNWDDGPQCEKKHKGIYSGCSAKYGVFNGRFSCTPDDLNEATIKNRQKWFNAMLGSVDTNLPKEFTNINGILTIFTATNTGIPDSWASWGDAGILASIQNGLAMSKEKTYIQGSSPYAGIADDAWNDYFDSFEAGRPKNEYLRLWGTAEGVGTTYGRLLAQDHGQTKSEGEMLFLGVGDLYRNALKVRQDPATMTPMVGSAYGWFMDTSSTIPGTNIPPVAVVAYFLLKK